MVLYYFSVDRKNKRLISVLDFIFYHSPSTYLISYLNYIPCAQKKHQIHRSIYHASFLLHFSDNSSKTISSLCKKELSFAKRRNIPIVSIIVHYHLPFSTTHVFQLFSQIKILPSNHLIHFPQIYTPISSGYRRFNSLDSFEFFNFLSSLKLDRISNSFLKNKIDGKIFLKFIQSSELFYFGKSAFVTVIDLVRKFVDQGVSDLVLASLDSKTHSSNPILRTPKKSLFFNYVWNVSESELEEAGMDLDCPRRLALAACPFPSPSPSAIQDPSLDSYRNVSSGILIAQETEYFRLLDVHWPLIRRERREASEREILEREILERETCDIFQRSLRPSLRRKAKKRFSFSCMPLPLQSSDSSNLEIVHLRPSPASPAPVRPLSLSRVVRRLCKRNQERDPASVLGSFNSFLASLRRAASDLSLLSGMTGLLSRPRLSPPSSKPSSPHFQSDFNPKKCRFTRTPIFNRFLLGHLKAQTRWSDMTLTESASPPRPPLASIFWNDRKFLSKLHYFDAVLNSLLRLRSEVESIVFEAEWAPLHARTCEVFKHPSSWTCHHIPDLPIENWFDFILSLRESYRQEDLSSVFLVLVRTAFLCPWLWKWREQGPSSSFHPLLPLHTNWSLRLSFFGHQVRASLERRDADISDIYGVSHSHRRVLLLPPICRLDETHRASFISSFHTEDGSLELTFGHPSTIIPFSPSFILAINPPADRDLACQSSDSPPSSPLPHVPLPLPSRLDLDDVSLLAHNTSLVAISSALQSCPSSHSNSLPHNTPVPFPAEEEESQPANPNEDWGREMLLAEELWSDCMFQVLRDHPPLSDSPPSESLSDSPPSESLSDSPPSESLCSLSVVEGGEMRDDQKHRPAEETLERRCADDMWREIGLALQSVNYMTLSPSLPTPPPPTAPPPSPSFSAWFIGMDSLGGDRCERRDEMNEMIMTPPTLYSVLEPVSLVSLLDFDLSSQTSSWVENAVYSIQTLRSLPTCLPPLSLSDLPFPCVDLSCDSLSPLSTCTEDSPPSPPCSPPPLILPPLLPSKPFRLPRLALSLALRGQEREEHQGPSQTLLSGPSSSGLHLNPLPSSTSPSLSLSLSTLLLKAKALTQEGEADKTEERRDPGTNRTAGIRLNPLTPVTFSLSSAFSTTFLGPPLPTIKKPNNSLFR